MCVDTWAVTVPIVKLDRPKGLVTGWVAFSTDALGAPVIDYQGDYIPIDELQKAVHDAMATISGKGAAGDMHMREGAADVVDSMVITDEIRKAAGLGDGPQGWLVTLRVKDPSLLSDIVSGRKMQMSLKGRGRRVPMEAA